MKKILLISILIVAAIWWLWPAEEQEILKTHANVETFDEGLNLKALVDSTQSERRKKVVVVPEVEVAERQEGSIEKQKTLTYLQVYHQLQLAKSCNKFFSELITDENVDFDQWLVNAMRKARRDEMYQPKKSQYDLLHQHVVECTDLKDHVMGLSHQVSIKSATPTDNNNSIIVDELEEQLSKTKAQTDKEKDIAMSLVLIDEWKTLLTQLADISQGVDSLSAEEVLDLINQIKTLNKSKYAPENVKDGQAQIRIALEISDLRERISKQKLVDEKLRDKVLLEFNVKTETLFQLLYSAGPEVFAEVNQAMNLAHNKLFATYTGRKRIRNYEVDALVPEYVFPMTINQSLLGGIDSEWLKINGDHIDRLIYCNLGGDCSAQSLLVRNLCLPIFGSRVEPEVCGLGVETFMRRKLLSPNQLQDIRFVVDWLEVQYGS